MIKPRIEKINSNFWSCASPLCIDAKSAIGFGETPVLAYKEWKDICKRNGIYHSKFTEIWRAHYLYQQVIIDEFYRK